MKFAIAVLLGLVSVQGINLKYRPDPKQSPWAKEEEPEPPRPYIVADSGSAYYTR